MRHTSGAAGPVGDAGYQVVAVPPVSMRLAAVEGYGRTFAASLRNIAGVAAS